MTANQRRPGFRLPWSSEEDGSMNQGEPAATAADAAGTDAAPVAAAADSAGDAVAPPATTTPEAETGSPAVAEPTKAAAPAESDASPAPTPPTDGPETGDEFMRDLVTAMRSVAEEARQAGMTDLKDRADEQVRTVEGEAETRRAELRRLADADVAGVGDWATAEGERIKMEAEQKIVARRARLDQELAADASRTEADATAVRERVAEYERELEAYHAQLSEISDPAAFAAAAKRLPKPPALGGSAAAAATPGTATPPAAVGASAPTSASSGDDGSNGTSAPDESPAAEVLASRLAELDATLPEAKAAAATEVVEAAPPAAEQAVDVAAEPAVEAEPAPSPAEAEGAAEGAAEKPEPATNDTEPAAAPAAPAAPVGGEPTVTEVVVKGLGSFGAITGFRQSLSGVDGIDSVALSLGQTGEFVFRATHAPGFNVRGAIKGLEGDGAKIEDRAEGGLRVTLEKAR